MGTFVGDIAKEVGGPIYESDEFIEKFLKRNLQERKLKDKLPETLYHYTDSSGLLGIVTNKNIWATNIKYLNDAKEFYYARNLAEDVIQCSKVNDASGLTSHLKESFLKGIRALEEHEWGETKFYVVSFSEHGDRLSQWRGYGKQIGGYSLGFSFNNLKTLSATSGPEKAQEEIRLVPCLYDEEKQRDFVQGWLRRMADLTKKYTKKEKKLPGENALAFVAGEMVNSIAPVFKHKTFIEEAEWRLVQIEAQWRLVDSEGDLVKHERVPDSLRAGQTTLIPYKALPLTEKEKKLKFAKVVVGPTPLPKLAKEALNELLKEHAELDDKDIHNSESPLRVL